MLKDICDKCEHECMEFCGLYWGLCKDVKQCIKVQNNPADAKIRVRAKRLLRKNGILFQNDINNASLISLIILVRKLQRCKKRNL